MGDELGPEAVIRVEDPVTGMRGVLVIDNSVLGPAGGGTRMLPDLSVDEVAALARAMTFKWAIFGLPTGGSKAGIFADPGDASRAQARGADRVRPRARAVPGQQGPSVRVGPDMGITGQDADTIYEGACTNNVVTWESSDAWTLDGDCAAYHLTGRGVVAASAAGLASLGRDLNGATFAIQGFGQAGVGTARYLCEHGARVVAISTLLGGVYDANGLDIPRLLELRREHGDGCVLRYEHGQQFEKDQLFAMPVDVLVPGARPRAIDAYNAAAVKAKIVCPAGNLCVTDEAEYRLHRAGVLCLPDFVANAGGSSRAGSTSSAATCFKRSSASAGSSPRPRRRSSKKRACSRNRRGRPHAAAFASG